MATPSMSIFMDSTDWLKNKNPEKTTPDSSSMDPISCMVAPPASSVFDRRLRPPHEEALKCPRCDSTNTKFCYYNNYSLSQPRYFCKTCRRYWTKGGSLRNVPVGGGCRRNKRPASKKPAADATDLRLSFSDVQQPHLTTSQENTTPLGFNFMEYYKYNLMNESPAAGGLSVMDTNNNNNNNKKSGAMLEDYMGIGDTSHGLTQLGFLGDDSNSSALWFANAAEGKTALEWQEQYCTDIGRASVGYSNGLGMWAGMIDGHGPYGTNSY